MTINNHTQPNSSNRIDCDIAIIGGGVAGLWLLDLLRNRGYDAVLCEQLALGGAQSIASQGMIHGGIKYALGAALTGASEAIARMPERWRSCLDGSGEVDLRGVRVVANEYHMWSNGKLGKLSSFFASRALRGRVEELAEADYPEVFRHADFTGTVHKLHDLVLDVTSLLRVLSAPHANRLISGRAISTRFSNASVGTAENIEAVALADGRELNASQFVFTAGAGNTEFCAALNQAGHTHAPATQLRPLHQAFVKHPELTELFAHCLTGIRGAEPRLTITTHPLERTQSSNDNRYGWYIGGHLATAGVKRTTANQIDVTRRELSATLPWIDWRKADITTLRIDRAEPRQQLGTKPDEACLVRCGNALVCWPTKLSLVPDLGDQVLNALDPPHPQTAQGVLDKAGGLEDLPPSHLSIARVPWLSEGLD